MNLCVNARDACRRWFDLNKAENFAFLDASYARIHIEAKAGRFVRITVVTPDRNVSRDQSRIFEPFFTTKR